MSFTKIKTQKSKKKKGKGRTKTRTKGPSIFHVNLGDFESVILVLRHHKIVLLFLSFKMTFESQKSNLKRDFTAYFSENESFWAQKNWHVVQWAGSFSLLKPVGESAHIQSVKIGSRLTTSTKRFDRFVI